jgi:hypothetical protein
VRRLALLLAVSTVAAAVAGLTWGTSAFAAPARPDLVVDLTVGAARSPRPAGSSRSRSWCATSAPRPPTMWR